MPMFWPHILIGAAATGFLFLFAITSVRESKGRAAKISGALALATALVWAAPLVLGAPWPIPALMDFLLLLLLALFFAPVGANRPIRSTGPVPRVDERDMMFSREDYREGTPQYEEYYSRRPDLKDVDDRIRRLPELLAPGGLFYDPVRSTYADAMFKVIDELLDMADGPVAQRAEDQPRPDPERMSAVMKELTRDLGAAEVGITELDPSWIYSHVGRGPEPWGSEIDLKHRYAIVFCLEMDQQKVEQAPGVGITEESARQYLQEAIAAITIARHIRDMGFPARAQISGSNYQVMLPPLAVDAGLGELGRMGYFISHKLGSRVRLGAVTTDLPLISDSPDGARGGGVREFCEVCKRCADSCPSGSIPDGDPVMVRGVQKWPMQVEPCVHYWRVLGTDCGMCMKVCPYSHPRTFVHQVIRLGIERSAFARRVAALGEDLFYGRIRKGRYCNISREIPDTRVSD